MFHNLKISVSLVSVTLICALCFSYALVDFGLAQKAPVPLYEANKSLGNKIGETTSESSSDKENCKQNESAQSGKSENSRSSLGSYSHNKNSDIPLSLSQKLNRTQVVQFVFMYFYTKLYLLQLYFNVCKYVRLSIDCFKFTLKDLNNKRVNP